MDLKQAYEAALAELSPRCREVFVLRRHDQIDTGAVAVRFGISTRMVQKYMARATAHLEERLSPFIDPAHSGTPARAAGRPAPPLCFQLSELV